MDTMTPQDVAIVGGLLLEKFFIDDDPAHPYWAYQDGHILVAFTNHRRGWHIVIYEGLRMYTPGGWPQSLEEAVSTLLVKDGRVIGALQ